VSLLEKFEVFQDALKSILEVLEQNREKLDRLLAKKVEKDWSLLEEPEGKPTIVEEVIQPTVLSNFALPKTGKYQWYRLKGDDKAKLRKCNNEGCSMFLKFNGDKKKYEHWKYDANTGVGGYVQDKCDYYVPEVEF